MPSFDIVSQVNTMELENAVNQAKKELSNRFDFKASKAEIVLDKKEIKLTAEDEFKVAALNEMVIGRLAKQYEKSQPDRLMNGNVYTKLIFETINGHKLFPKYGRLFKPITFDNAYNQVLIRQLIDDNNLDLAKKYCR